MHRIMLWALVFCPLLGHAMQNEPRDFLGMEWGAPIETYRASLKVITEDENSGYYRRVSDRPYFAGIEVRRISYYFHKGRFVAGTFLSVGTNDFNRIVAHLTQRHGPPQSVHTRHRVYAWEGEHAGVTISCDITISCYTEFFDKALRLQELEGSGKREDD
ncbi:MAG: hypothetical protein EXR36_00075 [Betaproteobacteria bacterium]|nr:hypothetical protein [Betaproteobacteria bacterium]